MSMVPYEPEDAFGIPGARWTENELRLPHGVPREQWESIVLSLGRMATSVAWWAGDAIVYGENEYGESYAQIEALLEQAGFPLRARETLWNYASVCRAVPHDRREVGLAFSHHAAVASAEPDEQVAILKRAVEKKWKVADVRDAMRGRALPKKSPAEDVIQRIGETPISPDLDRLAGAIDRLEKFVGDTDELTEDELRRVLGGLRAADDAVSDALRRARDSGDSGRLIVDVSVKGPDWA